MQAEGNEHHNEVPPPGNVKDYVLAVDADAVNDWDLRDMQEKCLSYGLKVPVNAGGIFRIALVAVKSCQQTP